MPEYRRAFCPGGTFFLTVVSNFRRPILTTDLGRKCLRESLIATQRDWPFTVDAVVLLPDHVHWVWTLPKRDADFSTRLRLIKGRFTHAFLSDGGLEAGRSESRKRKGERSVWQRRFYEHTVRDDDELYRIFDYIHFNPVKHGYATCPHAWPFSSFHRFSSNRKYDASWNCSCAGRVRGKLTFDDIGTFAGE